MPKFGTSSKSPRPSTPVEINVRVTPKASKNKVELQSDGSLKVWVTAAPTDGQANDAVVETIAKALKVGKRSVEIVKGHSTRDKRVRVEGVEESALAVLKPQGELFE